MKSHFDLAQGSAEWHDFRINGIGGSDIAAIVGKCKFKTAHHLWLEKVGLSKGFEGNFATQRGSELEAKARSRYELINLEDMPPAVAIHHKYPMCRVSLDGIRKDGRLILELKCPGEESHSIAKEGNVPDHYIPQVQYQLAVTGADYCHYFSYHDKTQDSVLVEVNPNWELQGVLILEAEKFWNNHVLTKIPPALTDRDDKVVEGGEIESICSVLLKGSKTMAKKELELLKSQVLELGGHMRVRCGRVLVTKLVGENKKPTLRLTIAKEKIDL